MIFAVPVFLFAAAAFAGPPRFPFINGIRLPTPEQEKYLEKKVVKIKSVQPNSTAFARSKASPGLTPGLPSAVNNWQYLPKVGDQEGGSDCVAWAVCYYYKTYQESREHGWGNPDYSVNPEHVFSPAFCYDLANYGGVHHGSYPSEVIQLVADYGVATWQEMPHTGTDYLAWPSQAVWKNAIAYRAQSTATIDLRTDAGITALKQQLANGDLAVINMIIYDNFYDNYPNDYEGINNGVLYEDAGYIDGGHAVTVTGYDDNKSYVDGAGVTKYGAFKIVNSFGPDWGILDTDIGTKGFMWMSYDYMRDRTSGTAWTMVDRINYQPSVYGTFGLQHPARGDLDVVFMGGNDENAPDWSFDALHNLGGNNAIDQKIVVDLSSYNPDFKNKFWLKVNDSASNADTGQITFMSVQQAGGGEIVSTDTPKATQNGRDVYVQLCNQAVMPAAPAGDVYTGVYSGGVTVNWSSGTAVSGYNPAGTLYKVELSTAPGFKPVIDSSQTYNLSAGFAGLSPNTTYYSRVQALGYCAAEPSAFVTLAALPAGSEFLEVWRSSAVVQWSGNGDPAGTSFEAEYWTAGGSTTSLTVNLTSAVLTGLTQETTVYARVRALNYDGSPTAYDSIISTFIPNTVAVILSSDSYTLVYDHISLDVLPDTFYDTATVLIQKPAIVPPDSGGLEGFIDGVVVDISARNPAAQILQPLKEVTVTADYNGVSLAGADEDTLVIANYNALRSVWVPLFSTRDKSAKTVTAKAGHFSLFQLMHSPAALASSGITVGPNPLRPVLNPGTRFTFRHLPSGTGVKIYTYLGELLYETAADAAGMAVWDGKNKSGRLVASDIYLALLEWKGEKKIMKLVVEK